MTILQIEPLPIAPQHPFAFIPDILIVENRLHISQLQIGMFVTELDRPWLDTPFLLQGFLIENGAQLDELSQYCQYVTIDLARSVGGPFHWSHLPAQPARNPEEELDISRHPPEEQERLSILLALREMFSSARMRRDEDAPTSAPRIVIYEESAPVEQEISQARSVHDATQLLVSELMTSAREDTQPHSEEVNEAVSTMVDSIIRNPNALLWLSQMKNRDSYSYSHAVDSSIYLLAFGRELGFPREDLHKLGFAGLMLDIGKMRLPNELLTHTGRYTPGEFMLMKTHVQHSLDILGQMDDVPMDVFDMVARHHERYDGSGYPYGLKGEALGIFGSMASIVDCFTAITSDRAYSAAKSPHEALQLLYKWSDRFFHPVLVEQFAQCVGVFPVGTLVELTSGDIAIVVGQNYTRRLKPKVMTILGPDHQPHAKPLILDLITDPPGPGDQPLTVRRVLPRGSFGIDPREYFL